MPRPVDWMGQSFERRSRQAVERLSESWWRRFQRRRLVTLWCAEALVLAAILAGLVFLWSGRVVIERQAVAVAEAEAAVREQQAALQQRTCLEWPDWCRQAKPGWWAIYRKGAK